MIEIWKPIEGYDNYMVSNLGRVKSLNYNRTGKEKLLKPSTQNGYLSIGLSKNGKLKKLRVNRVVAEAFIPNPDNKSFIDHINTDRTDNRVDNLRWVTNNENMNNHLTLIKCSESKKGKLNPKHKSILQFDLNGNFIRKWDCIKDTGFHSSHISKCCNGKRKTAYGYIWKYEEINELKNSA